MAMYILVYMLDLFSMKQKEKKKKSQHCLQVLKWQLWMGARFNAMESRLD